MMSLKHLTDSRGVVLLSVLAGFTLLIPLLSYTNGLAVDQGGPTDPPDAPRENVGCNKIAYENDAGLASFGVGDAGSCPTTTTIASSLTISSPAQSGRIFRDGFASACDPPKSYPGTINVGTLYYYNAYAFTNPGTIPSCVTVYFDPNSGANPCGSNAFAIAYANSYDPTDQGVNYLGDVGSSATQPFSFVLPAGQNLVLNFSNTNGTVACDFSFSVTNVACQTSIDLGISKSAPAAVNMGIPITYTISAALTGMANLDATDVVISDVLPVGVSYIRSNASTGSYDPFTGVWTIPTITYGTTETLYINVKGMISGTVTNTANYASSTEQDMNNLNDSATVRTTVGPMLLFIPFVGNFGE